MYYTNKIQVFFTPESLIQSAGSAYYQGWGGNLTWQNLLWSSEIMWFHKKNRVAKQSFVEKGEIFLENYGLILN